MQTLDLTGTWTGYISLILLAVALLLVFFEHKTHMRKSKPVLLGAGLVWMLIALSYHGTNQMEIVTKTWEHSFLDFAKIMMFIMTAMVFINVLRALNVFDALRSRLVRRGWGFIIMFWMLGIFTFFLSAGADNAAAAIIMTSVAIAVGGGNLRFTGPAITSVVVAANAGGAFSPFGDVTTYMAWSAGVATFWTFFYLFPAALVNWLVPALGIARSIPREKPVGYHEEPLVRMLPGARRIMALFVLTIVMAVIGHSYLHLPPVAGMLFGLGMLMVFGFFLKIKALEEDPFDMLPHVQDIEWDSLLFFFGIIMMVAGIGLIGYLELLSSLSYQAWGPFSQEEAITIANTGVGLISAVIDNIPTFLAVLLMDPTMSTWQWLLVTMTAGVGGSILATGSAAGVAALGASRGQYTFMTHLRCSHWITLGYFASIGTHYVTGMIFSHLHQMP